jgi:transposase
MQNELFEAALGIAKPWYVRGVDFDAARKLLTIGIDFVAGSRFAAPGIEGLHRVDDTQTERLRHLNFFQHECYLEVRTPRVKLPDGPPAPGSTAKDCAPSSIASRSMSSPPCSSSGAPMSCVQRSRQ